MPQSPAYEPAYLGRRLAAMLYDGLLLLAMWIVTCLIWFPLYGAAVSGPLLTGVLTAETLAFMLTAGAELAKPWECAPGVLE